MYLQLFPLPIQTDIIWSKTIYTSKYYLNGKELEKFQKKKQILIFYTTFLLIKKYFLWSLVFNDK
jgi:hypothetical protein